MYFIDFFRLLENTESLERSSRKLDLGQVIFFMTGNFFYDGYFFKGQSKI